MSAREDSGYEQFLTAVQPYNLNLSSCTAVLDRELFWKLREHKTRKGKRELKARYRVAHISRDFFDVVAEFKITIVDPESKAQALSVECSFLTHIHTGKQPVNKEHAERFAASEFRIVIWPYFRQFVSDTTGRMGIPPIFIPISIRQPDQAPAVELAVRPRRRAAKT